MNFKVLLEDGRVGKVRIPNQIMVASIDKVKEFLDPYIVVRAEQLWEQDCTEYTIYGENLPAVGPATRAPMYGLHKRYSQRTINHGLGIARTLDGLGINLDGTDTGEHMEVEGNGKDSQDR